MNSSQIEYIMQSIDEIQCIHMEDFNFKLQLLGYYWKENQRMNPEANDIEKAEMLLSLLQISFSDEFVQSVPYEDFKQAFSSNAVFIFRDANWNYYAYSPKTKNVRVTNVVYNSKVVHKVPSYLRIWFLPGEKIMLKKGVSFKEENTKKLVTLQKGAFDYPLSSISVKRKGDDDILYLKNHQYALSEYYKDKTQRELEELISLRWIYFREEENECYEDCDGWDYSNCDMERCKEDCETCGGRRYKCNKSCFVNRHKTVVQIDVLESKLAEDVEEGNRIVKELNVQNKKLDKNLLYVSQLYEDLLKHKKYYDTNTQIDAFVTNYNSYIQCQLEQAIDLIDNNRQNTLLVYNELNDELKEWLSILFNLCYKQSCQDSMSLKFVESYSIYKYNLKENDIRRSIDIIKDIKNRVSSSDEESFITDTYQLVINIPSIYQNGIISQLINLYGKIDTYKFVYRIQEGIKFIDKINEPHSNFYKEVVPSELCWLEDMYDKLDTIPGEVSLRKLYSDSFIKMKRILRGRKSNSKKVVLEINQIQNNIRCAIEYSDIKIMDDNLFWGKDIVLSIDGYDNINDILLKREFKMKLESHKKELLRKYKEQSLHRVKFVCLNNNKWEVFYS